MKQGKTRMARRCAAVIAPMLLVLGAGCVYRIDIQQGNFLEHDEIDQIESGMTRSQVRYLLGTPMVSDVFRDDRWDYVYYLKKGRSRKIEERHFIVYFEGDQVVRVERPLADTNS
jgi:outer membrane protein assembly factor BamE